jgi:L-ascorbate metabolism protein UlaG (beta-lactamase superfamily)
MAGIECDVALLPVGGTYTMTADEAAQAAEDIGPRVAVPMHWGDIVGDEKDPERFRSLYGGEVAVLDAEC